MPIGRRLYVQFLIAILPLALLVVWLALSRNDLPQRVNAALKAYDLSLESASAFRDFMGGVADALDTGRLGSSAVASLKRSHESAKQLAAVSPEDAPLPGRVAAIETRLSANPSLDTILPLKEEAQALRAALLSSSEAKRAALSRLVEEEESNARRKRELLYVAALGALLLVGFTAFILRRLVRGITTPLAQTVAVAHAIAEGRLDTPIVVRGNDELAHLQVAMKAMQDNLCVIVRAVRSAAESVADASQSLSAETQDLSQRSEEQAASLEEAAASMEQLSTAVRENSSNAVEAERLAR
jgi:nitrate/nitrite-specific signal transduction histidine kinase